jgi:hypothetical protein
MLKAPRQPVNELSNCRQFHIRASTPTGAVAPPNLVCRICRARSCNRPARSGIRGGNEDASDVFKALSTLKSIEKFQVGWHFNAQITD